MRASACGSRLAMTVRPPFRSVHLQLPFPSLGVDNVYMAGHICGVSVEASGTCLARCGSANPSGRKALAAGEVQLDIVELTTLLTRPTDHPTGLVASVEGNSFSAQHDFLSTYVAKLQAFKIPSRDSGAAQRRRKYGGNIRPRQVSFP